MHMILAKDRAARRALPPPAIDERKGRFVQNAVMHVATVPVLIDSSVPSPPAFDFCRLVPNRVSAPPARPLL